VIIIVPEATISELITPADALNAIEAVFSAMDKGDARNFPVVREPLAYRDALYGFKSGFDRAHGVLGVKSGGVLARKQGTRSGKPSIIGPSLRSE